MPNQVFQHSDDDGALSVIASGNTVILACEKGHYWILESTQYSKESVTEAVSDRFSPEVGEALLRRFL